MDNVEKITISRTEICSQVPPLSLNTEEEGGCGVTGSVVPVWAGACRDADSARYSRVVTYFWNARSCR